MRAGMVSSLQRALVEGGSATATKHMSTLLYLDDEEQLGRVISRFFSRRGDRVLLARAARVHPVGVGVERLEYPVIHKPFELDAHASSADRAEHRAQA